MYYHTNSMGPEHEALKVAFKKCGELAQQGKYTSVGLAVPTKGNLDGVMDL